MIESAAPPALELGHNQMCLHVRPGTSEAKKQVIVEEWYRAQLKQAVPELLVQWEPLLGVHVERFFVRKMKTKWGSCNAANRSIRLNTDLAKKPVACLEYLVVHELIHFLEPTHNLHFQALMDKFLPKWKYHREALNRLPVRHEEWGY